MEKQIVEFGKLNDTQKLEAVELFLIGFGHFMTFSKDEEKKKKLFLEIFSPDLFVCYLENDNVLGLMGLGNNKTRPIDFKKEICQNEACSYGNYKKLVTEVFSKNENAINFYKKNGFIVKIENKGSMMRMFGSGYPITMTKQIK